MQDSAPPASCRFGQFELRADECLLLANGAPVALGARAFALLVVLVERAGRLVTKNDLLALVWPGLVVEENNLQVQVSALRKLLGPTALTTIPGRGYRFDLPVERPGGVPTAAGDSVTAGVPLVTPALAPTNLPGRLPTLYGRSADLAAIKALLRERPVVTISGAGGIGKTRAAQAVATELAMERAADFPDGVWWVEMAAISEPDLVPSTVARVLGVQVPGDRATAETVAAALAARQLLLVLDNCEHLTDAVAGLAGAIGAAAARVVTLVTSQEPLKASEEHVYRIGALAVPDAVDAADALQSGAVELFVARARAVDPRFELTTAHIPSVIEICRRLDGIPLAIELAAARLPLLGVEGLRARLDERFNLLTAGARVVPRRHQTLRATLEWSHALLTPDEQTVFRRLGVFAGTFTLEAAQYVASDTRIDAWAALDHLGALVDKSLVLAEGDPVPRYRLLETTRSYALERLAEAAETKRAMRSHAEAIVRVLAAYADADRQWDSAPGAAAALAAELDNLRAAFAWAAASDDDVGLALQVAGASFPVWMATAHLAEGLDRCLALRDRVREGGATRAVAQFWLTVAELGWYTTRREPFDAALRAAELFRALGDDDRRYDALLCGAILGSRLASTDELHALIEEAARLERPGLSGRRRSILRFARYRWNMRVGRYAEALACAQEQARINRDEGRPIAEMYAMSNVTTAEIRLGRTEAGLAHARAAIARLETLGAAAGAGHLYLNVMNALFLLGRLDEGIAAGRTAHALLRNEGDQLRVLTPLALCAALQGRLADAARLFGLVQAARARDGVRADSFWEICREQLEALLADGLPPDEIARLRAEGAALREEHAFKIGFGDVT